MTAPAPSRFAALRRAALVAAAPLVCSCSSEPGARDGDWSGGLSFDSGATCRGDEHQYDSNAFAASLAVATAKELGRWDAIRDFELRTGKLELSGTGELRCSRSAGCPNVRALLRLQDDAASDVPGHDPVRYRSQLASWYRLQKQQLVQLVDGMLSLDKGVYRLRNRLSGKYLQIDSGALEDGAPAEQHATPSQPGADQWRVRLDHGSHQLINVRSGKCLSLSDDSSADDIGLVQQTCSASSALQRFGFATVDQYYSVRTKTGLSLRVKDAGLTDDIPVVQFAWSGSNWSELWTLEPVGASALPPDALADATYTLVAQHSNKAITVDGESLADEALIEQREYSGAADSFHWYLQRVNEKKYRLVNRMSGKCMDLQTASASSRLVQRGCSDAPTQQFMIVDAGDGSNVLYGLYGRSIEVEGSSLADGAALAQGNDSTWASHRQFLLTPVLAGEPQHVSFSHASDDGPCGGYLWYDLTQPDGEPLSAASESFVQLVFAGGKSNAAEPGPNPYISQPASGNQVALDPAGSMLAGAISPGSDCLDGALFFAATGDAAGRCCLDDQGRQGALHESSWSATTFVCR